MSVRACACLTRQFSLCYATRIEETCLSVLVRVCIDLLTNDLFHSFRSTIALVRFVLIFIVSRISRHPRENRPFQFWKKFVCAARYSEENGILLKNHRASKEHRLDQYISGYIFLYVYNIYRVCVHLSVDLRVRVCVSVNVCGK